MKSAIVKWIETTVQNPNFRLFINLTEGLYGYSLNSGPITWCRSKQEAEQAGK